MNPLGPLAAVERLGSGGEWRGMYSVVGARAHATEVTQHDGRDSSGMMANCKMAHIDEVHGPVACTMQPQLPHRPLTD
jgi:hypothetical protein